MSTNGTSQKTPANGAARAGVKSPEPETDVATLLRGVADGLLEQTKTARQLVEALAETNRYLRLLCVSALVLLVLGGALVLGRCTLRAAAPGPSAPEARPLILSRFAVGGEVERLLD